MYMRNIILAGLGLWLAACATGPSGPAFNAAHTPIANSDKAVLYVYREYAEPVSSKASVYIDGHEIIVLPQGTFSWVYITPGTHHVVYKWNEESSMPVSEYDKQFAKGNSYVYEMIGSVADLRPRSFLRKIEMPAARKTMQQCCKYVKPLTQTVN